MSWRLAYRPRIVPNSWLFPSPYGKRWDPDNFSQDFRAANAAAQLPWACLDFPHTFGSQLAMKGESLYKISTLMGNSPEICRRHYAALLPEALEASVEFVASQSFVYREGKARVWKAQRFTLPESFRIGEGLQAN